MKKWIFITGILTAFTGFAQPEGYEISVTFKPFKNQYIYLGHYFGKQYPIIDSALLNENGQTVFKGSKNLPGGIYLIGYPNKAGFFEILIDKEQRFSVIADTATIRSGVQFINSPGNELFVNYQQQMGIYGSEISAKRRQLAEAKTTADSAALYDRIDELDSLIKQYREDLIKKNPGNMLSEFLVTMREPELPESLKTPTSREDSLNAYYYFRNHFWDGVNFWDGRLAYTPFFDDKMDKYINELLPLNPDSVKKEIDYMMGFASVSPEMTRFLLLKFVNRYLNQKYMWEDAVFVHLFEKYFAQKEYGWLTAQGRKTITDRAYSLMANIMGKPAPEIELPDSTGKMRSLYSEAASYTVVFLWDPTCGHCKEVAPKLDSLYRNKWKASGVKLFAMGKETDGNRDTWLKVIRDLKLEGWTHVYYTKEADKARIDASIPGYSQLYDVQSFPTLYLLDKDKRIIAKKLTWQQTDEVLQMKINGQ